MRELSRRGMLLSALGLGGTMTLRGDDPLADLFTPAPAVQAQTMMYRQGVIKTFNRLTLENTVDIGGSTFQNLNVLGVAEAASLRPGSVVGVMAVGSTWAIIGRLVAPNTPEATDAITQVSQQVYTNMIAAFETAVVGPFADLATVGPTVVVDIRASGQALVFLSADAQVNADGILMSFAASGANTIAASTAADLFFRRTDAGGTNRAQFSLLEPLTGLNPGLTTFTAKYAASVGGGHLIGRRKLTVLAF